MSTASAATVEARLMRLALGIEALHRAIRSTEAAPAALVERWTRFHAYWRAMYFGLESLPSAERERVLERLAAFAARWRESLPGWGVPLEDEAHIGFDGIITPSRGRARLDSIHAEVTTHDRAFQAQRTALGESFLAAWGRWRDSWQAFYGRYDSDWDWWTLGNASAWNEALVYQQRLVQWRASAERAGARFSIPRPQAPPEREPENNTLSQVRDIAIAGAVGAAIIGSVYLVFKVV